MNKKSGLFHLVFHIPLTAWRGSQWVLFFMTAMGLMLAVLTLVNQLHIRAERERFDRAYAVKLNLELSLHIQNMREHSVQVEQWLVDISATRGLNGLDDGFKLALKNATLFRQGVPILARILEKQHPEKDESSRIHALEETFDRYYQTGLDMANAYIHSGTLRGNDIMKTFREQGESIEKQLEEFLTRAHEAPASHMVPTAPQLLSWFPPARIWKLLMGRDSYRNYVHARDQILAEIDVSSQNRLAQLAQSIRVDILRIQHWLTAVSVTRGRDGMDEGFTRAQQHYDRFQEKLPLLRQLLAVESDSFGGMGLIKTLDQRMAIYYQNGLKMADAYIRGGATLGNPVMATFDDESTQLADLLQPMLEPFLVRTGLNEYQVNLARQGIGEVASILWVLMLLWLVLIVGSDRWLLRLSQQPPPPVPEFDVWQRRQAKAKRP
ncbi:MAG: hypothetical protein HQL81_15295 [Magnetococcales bacterium]|nr:hypothetical protein [Magnetococcales bacterium]